MKTPEAMTKLVEATIQQIEMHGLARLTVRSVAAAAGVNIAAVNYYFRSKDALVAAALEGSARHFATDALVMIGRLEEDPETNLTELLVYVLEGGARYPQIARAQLHDGFLASDFSGSFPIQLAPILASLRDALEGMVKGLSREEASHRVVAAMSGVFFPTVFAGLYRPLGVLGDVVERERYARGLARAALSAPTAKAPSPDRAGKKRAPAKRR